MRRRRRSAAALELAIGVVLAGCADGSGGAPLADSLCPTVQAWSDSTVDIAKGFRLASRDLDPSQRRARYVQSFDELSALHDRLAEALSDLDLPDTVATRLDEVVEDVAEAIQEGLVEAEGLPDSAYEFVGVRDGSLFTGVEKGKAVMFNALAELTTDPDTQVPAGCGRRAALDLAPSATFPP